MIILTINHVLIEDFDAELDFDKKRNRILMQSKGTDKKIIFNVRGNLADKKTSSLMFAEAQQITKKSFLYYPKLGNDAKALFYVCRKLGKRQ